MARTYTERPIRASQPAKAADLNLELAAVARELNGGIDQHNVPLRSIVTRHLAPFVADHTTYPGTTSTYGAASSYHRTVRRAVDQNTPRIELDPGSDDAFTGWLPLWTLQASQITTGSVLEFVGRGGMLRGCAHLDVERRISYVERTEGGVSTYPFTHELDWIRFGVFADGALIADSYRLAPKRITVALPFGAPAPVGAARLELRVQANTVAQIAASTVAGVTWAYPSPAEKYPTIKIFGCSIVARNQYR